MKSLAIHIIAFIIVILFNDHYCQSSLVKQIKSINSEKDKIVQKKSKRTLHIEVIKPMIENCTSSKGLGHLQTNDHI